jgi:hypothetical protein
LRDADAGVVLAFPSSRSVLSIAGIFCIVVSCASTAGCDRGSQPTDPSGVESNAAAPSGVPAAATRSWVVPESAPGGAPYDDKLRAALAEALNAKPAEYAARTHHLRPDGSPLHTNRLIVETSPYLLQHAHNPVDWHPWGEEAFEKARALGRPVLLSVGYSTCHWCHVMERESFEDLEIATYINANYVAIKVDREELPDVDAVYMNVLQMLTGSGGWPMTLVLAPDRQPLFAGTYFPARDGDRGAGAGLLTILTTVRDRYAREGPAMAKEAATITKRLQAAAAPRAPGDLPGPRVMKAASATGSSRCAASAASRR